MKTLINTGRLYFWPIISANMVTMTLAIGSNPIRAAAFSVVLCCLSSFGFLLNDLWDRKVDFINQPGHFENASAGTLRVAFLAMSLFLASGLVFAYRIGNVEFAMASGIAVALTAYTILLRKMLLMPNILTACLASSPLWIPLMLWESQIDVTKLLFVFSIVGIISAREIFMDARDRRGDAIGGRETFATVFGPHIAKLTAATLTLGSIIPLIITILWSLGKVSLLGQLLVLMVLGYVLKLVGKAAIDVLIKSGDEQTLIRRYVDRSRLAMALIPILVVLLWH